jgi:hypothetical protein
MSVILLVGVERSRSKESTYRGRKTGKREKLRS